MENSKDFRELRLRELIVKCAMPAMVSMGIVAVYSVADGTFVGQFLGEAPLAAVNLVMPLFMIMTALVDMLATGSAVQIAKALGAGKKLLASRIFSCSLGIMAAFSCLIALAVFLGIRGVLEWLGSEPVVVEAAVDYIYIIAGTAPLCLLFFATDNYLRICGWQNFSMGLNIFAAVLNIILDYLLIVRFSCGIAGAAAATAISLSCGAALSLLPFILQRTELRFVRGMIPLKRFLSLAFNGSSELLDNVSGSVLGIIVNAVLLQIGGTTAVAALSVVMYLDEVVSMLVFGLVSSLQPALSYCHGARLRERTRKLQQYIMVAAAALSCVALALMLLLGPYALRLFIEPDNYELMELATAALSPFALSYLLRWADISISGYYTALDKPVVSLLLSLAGTLLFPLAALALLVPWLGLAGAWYMPLLAGICSALLSMACYLAISPY